MCGRFARKRSSAMIAKDFGVEEIVDDVEPSFNVAPTHPVAVIVNNGVKQLVAMRWGLVPFWAADPSIASKLINARAETLMSKAAFKEGFKRRRCLVVADGFFEWQKQGAFKTPFFIHLKGDQSFGFAGVYETWNPPLGEPLVTCTIITTDANELVRPIHDRMPVILPKSAEDFWLDPEVADHSRLLDLLHPYRADDMAAHTVSQLVNSVKNDSPECIEPAEVMGQPLLF